MSWSLKASSPETFPPRGDLVEELQPARERLREALLLGGQRRLDLRAVLLELGIGGAHVLDHGAGEPGEERRLEPDPLAVLHGAADDPAQDVAAPLVPGTIPSAARNVIARPWSASTRCAFVACSDSP